jgi:putative protein-disulfide isomerase
LVRSVAFQVDELGCEGRQSAQFYLWTKDFMNSSGMPVVVYGNDPLCGWCFAIGPEIGSAKESLTGLVDWQISCGGLVTGQRVRSIALDAQYLRSGFAQVKAVCGREPSEAYWENVVNKGTWVSNSEPVCRAIFSVQRYIEATRSAESAALLAIDFSRSLSDVLYMGGKLPDDPQTIEQLSSAVGLDGKAIVQFWSSEEAKKLTQRQFSHASEFGIKSYPSLLIRHRDSVFPIGTGFMASADIVRAVENILLK